jgi:hypothetical protein
MPHSPVRHPCAFEDDSTGRTGSDWKAPLGLQRSECRCVTTVLALAGWGGSADDGRLSVAAHEEREPYARCILFGSAVFEGVQLAECLRGQACHE